MRTIRKFADERCIWVEIDETFAQKAAYVWRQLSRSNELIEDADLFVAATALVYDYTVVVLSFQKRFENHTQSPKPPSDRQRFPESVHQPRLFAFQGHLALG